MKAQLIEGPITKTLVKMTLPMILGLLSVVVFNLADAFFVGRLGTLELAALSFTFPVVMMVGSIAIGISIGSSAVISRAIGEGNGQDVKRLATDSLLLALLLIVVLIIAGMLTIEPLFSLLGAETAILPMIKKYMMIWYPGMIFLVIPMVGNGAIRATGDTKTPGIMMMMAAAVNVLLDPLLIFGIGPFPRLGITGAAIATVGARFLTLLVALYVLIWRDKMLATVFVPVKNIIASWKRILYIALPTVGARVITPLGIGILTSIIALHGVKAVAGYGVAIRIEYFASIVIMALSSIMGPFIGQNWGAKKYDRVKTGLRKSTVFSILWSLGIFIILTVLAKPIAALFNRDKEVVDVIILYLRIVPLSYGLYGVLMLAASALNVLNKPFHATAMMLMQLFVFSIPLAIIGSKLLGLKGVFFAIFVSYVLSGIISNAVLQKVLGKETGNRE